MNTIKVASAFFSVGGLVCGTYAAVETVELAAQHAFEQQDGFMNPAERLTNEIPYIYMISGIGGACIAGSVIAAAGLVSDELSKQRSAKQAG